MIVLGVVIGYFTSPFLTGIFIESTNELSYRLALKLVLVVGINYYITP